MESSALAATLFVLWASYEFLGGILRWLNPFRIADNDFPTEIPLKQLKFTLNSDSHAFRKTLSHYLSTHPMFRTSLEELDAPLVQHRKNSLARVQEILSSGLVNISDISQNPLVFIALHELFAYTDASAVYVLSVLLNLYAGSIMKLGRKHHREEYLRNLGSGENIGCFALTEFSHGVQSGLFLDTEACFDADTQMFTLNSPRETAAKNWISLLSVHSKKAIVFAKLLEHSFNSDNNTEVTDRGVHAFLVDIRNENGEALPGVTIQEMGHKPCINGNDNGRLLFQNIRVPRDRLLDRFCDISASGIYSSSIENPKQRFLKAADQLVSGRMCIASAAMSLMKLAIFSAVRYSVSRKQSSRLSNKKTTSLFDNFTQKRDLFVAVSHAYACQFGVNKVKKLYAAMVIDEESRMTPSNEMQVDFFGSPERPDVVRLVCALKSYVTTECVRITELTCSKIGGQALLSENKLASLHNVAQSLVVVEGDAVVLAQKVSGELLKINGFGNSSAKSLWSMLKTRVRCALSGFYLYAMSFLANPFEKTYASRLFQYRVDRLLYQLMFELLAASVIPGKRGESPKDRLVNTWSGKSLDVVLELHRAFTEQYIHEQFVDVLDVSGEEGKVLALLREVWVCDRIEACGTWFLLNSCMRRSVIGSCKEHVKQIVTSEKFSHAFVLDSVSAFDIPEAVISIPIATAEWQEKPRFAKDL